MKAIREFLHKVRFDERWMLLTFLALAVAVPTIFFLVFLKRSLVSETELARSTNTSSFLSNLTEAQDALSEYLADHAAFVSGSTGIQWGPGETFTRLVEQDVADTIIILQADGQTAYPFLPKMRPASKLSETDRRAQDIRTELLSSTNPRTKWDAVLNIPRELVDAIDTSGRMIVPNLLLQALESAPLSEAQRSEIQLRLSDRILNYREPLVPSSQRLFLAREYQKLDPGFELPTQRAEQLAVEILQTPLPPLAPGVLTRANSTQDGWLLLSPNLSRIAYFRHNRISRELAAIARKHLAGQGLDVRMALASEIRPPDYVTHSAAGKSLPEWDIQVFRTEDAEREAGRQRTQRFIAIGAGVVALIGLVAFFSVRRYLAISRTTELRHDFLSTVSHELKTPLTSIRLLVETLSAGQWANPERTKQYTEVMQREITRLSHLVESFLTYTRLERGKLKFEFAETDPGQIADHAVAIVGARFRGNCDFIVDVAPDLPILTADSDTLITAVLNLLDNAYKYSSDRKRITFRVYEEKDDVLFSVSDNGIGLSPNDCRRVLQRYYRVDSEATRGIGGAGLGLSIVKNVAEAHGGELFIRSELGKGSCFTIRIPVHNLKKP